MWAIEVLAERIVVGKITRYTAREHARYTLIIPVQNLKSGETAQQGLTGGRRDRTDPVSDERGRRRFRRIATYYVDVAVGKRSTTGNNARRTNASAYTTGLNNVCDAWCRDAPSSEHADTKVYNTHITGCWQTYHYVSPTCTACGLNFTNTTYDEEEDGLVKTGYRARTYWSRHVNAYKMTRQVDCRWCGAPHLMPGCAKTPKQMGRHFRCSDNYFDTSMGSARCR